MLAVWIPSHYQLRGAGWGTPSTASKPDISREVRSTLDHGMKRYSVVESETQTGGTGRPLQKSGGPNR
ncbi:MAG: hypothetical protein AAFX02_00365, partial [Pseudomonadota bacterium]